MVVIKLVFTGVHVDNDIFAVVLWFEQVAKALFVDFRASLGNSAGWGTSLVHLLDSRNGDDHTPGGTVYTIFLQTNDTKQRYICGGP